jgi:hypothetical protein
MAKHKTDNEEDDPRIEDFMRPKISRRFRMDRRSITLWLDADIIEACKPQPGKILREWIESHFWKKV